MEENIVADNYFTIIPEWILYSEITPQAVRLYGVLRRYADRDGSCFPSRRRLANDLRVESTKPVDRALKELNSIGAISIQNRYTEQGDLQSNLYTVHSAPQGRDEKLPTSLPHGPHGGALKVPTVGTPNSHIMRANINESQDKETTQDLTDQFTDDVVALAQLLAELMEGNGVKRPHVTKKWLLTLDRMIRLDGRTAIQIEKAIRWSQNDEFWSANIHSPDALRKQYEKMRLQAKRGQTKGVNTVRQYIMDNTNE